MTAISPLVRLQFNRRCHCGACGPVTAGTRLPHASVEGVSLANELSLSHENPTVNDTMVSDLIPLVNV
jgi:hypothetical protein